MPATRLGDTFARLGEKNERALVVYLTAGYPSLDATVELAEGLVETGVDILEIGMPFSDPVADGPTIQAACQSALAGGATPGRVFETIGAIRERVAAPIVIMTYCNLVHSRGYGDFATRAAFSGADAVLVTDLPVAGAGSWLAASSEARLDAIFLVAPTSTDETIGEAARLGGGFLYCVSRLGTTGARDALPPDLEGLLGRIRARCALPVCVGFGISTPEHVRAVARMADGVVVGSAVLDRITQAGPARCVEEAARFCRELKAATM